MTNEPPGDDLQGREPEQTPPANDQPEPELPVVREADTEPDDYDLDLRPDGLYGEPAPLTDVSPWQPPPSRPGGGAILTSIIVIILAIAVVGATAFAVKTYREKALLTAATTQALALIGEGAPAELAAQVKAIRGDIVAGKSAEAGQKLAGLRTLLAKMKPAGGPGGGPGGMPAGPIPANAYDELTPDAATFFRGHEDLFRRFLMVCQRAAELKKAGADVTKLREARDAIVEAARMGQEEKVKQGLLQMTRMLRGPGGGPGGGAGAAAQGPLRQKADRLRREIERGRREGRMLRPALEMAQKAEAAANSGNMAAAEKFLDQALAAARRAPRMGRGGRDRRGMPMGGRGGRGGPQMEGRQNPLAPFMRALMGIMSVEEQNLKVVTDNLLTARGILFGDKPAEEQPDALKPLVDKALGELKTVADRRRDFSAKMNAAQRPGQGGQPQGPRPPSSLRDMEQAQREAILKAWREQIGTVIDRVRGMSDEDYQKERNLIIRDVLRTVTERPRQQQPDAAGPVAPAAAQWPADPATRVRAKMLFASPTLQQWELAGRDTKEVEDLFGEARSALYDNKLEDAEKLADRALVLLGLNTDAPVTLPAPPGDARVVPAPVVPAPQ